MKEFNINDVIDSLDIEIIQSLEKNHVWNYTTYRMKHGYNWLLSGRGGGKSTGIQTLSIKTFCMYGYQTIVLRANKDETTQNMMSTYFDNMRAIVFDDGKNMIEKISNGKYNTVYYNRSRKCFILCNENDNICDIKNNIPFMVMSSFDKSNEICSGFNYPDARIIFAEECLDDRISNFALLNLEHIISTVFRQKTDTYVILTGNLSRGNPRLLIDMKIYDKIKTSQIPYVVHKTKFNSKIGIELFDSLPEQNSQKRNFNDMYFCFDVAGEDIIRGCSNSIPIFRQIPKNIINPVINETGIYIYTFDRFFKICTMISENYQAMYYIEDCEEITRHDAQHIIITDDELYSYENPYVYINPLTKYPVTVDIIKAIRRKEVCYKNYMCCIATTNLLDTFGVSERI